MHEGALDAVEPIILSGDGDEWQEEWDDILEEIFWDNEGPSTKEISPANATLDMLNRPKSGKQQRAIVKQCKSVKKRTQQKRQCSRSVQCWQPPRPSNPQPAIQHVPVLLTQPSFMFGRPAYSPCCFFQTPHGCGNFFCFCWKYHIYQQKKMMGMKVRGRPPTHESKCPLKFGGPLWLNC